MFQITVIIPTFNRKLLLGRAVDSVLGQSLQADEIIIVDDGSTDETGQFVKSQYPRINYIYQNNKGVSAARNTGISNTDCDWICLLDSDDSWQANKLEKQVAALKNNPEYLIVHTNETWYRNGMLLKQMKKHEKKGGYIFQHCLPLCAISPSSVMINRRVFNDVGLFDETLPACEDYDMWLRICCNYPVLFIDEPLVNKFGGHEDQLSRKHWGMDRFRILALDKIIKSGELEYADKQAAINRLLEKITLFLKGAEKHGANEYSQQFEALRGYYVHCH